MKKVGNIIYADEGKILRRIEDKMIAGVEYALGYVYYIDGKLLSEKKLETEFDFEELTEAELKADQEYLYPIYVEQYIRERYTVSDELALLRQRDTKPDAFGEYNLFCEECKLRAKNKLGFDYEFPVPLNK